jgi:pantetheine-phosphate adenylyltransferase
MRGLAVYPGSFDPITNGHLDLIRRGSDLFDRLIVAVLRNTEKSYLFSVEDRLELLSESVVDLPNVEVAAFDGLLVDFARKRGAMRILRGIRALSDFELEFQMALMNRRLAPDLETVFLMPREEFTFLSSKLVREVARLGGPVDAFVPPPVARRLKQRGTP